MQTKNAVRLESSCYIQYTGSEVKKKNKFEEMELHDRHFLLSFWSFVLF